MEKTLSIGIGALIYLVAAVAAVPTQRGCGGKPADMVFLLDSSSSIWPPNFVKQISFVRDVVDQFDVRSENTRVSVLTFSNYVNEDFRLLSHGDHLSTLNAINSVHQLMGDTRTDMALLRAREILTSEGREAVPRLVIVMTDGRSDFPKQTVEEARLTKAAGISVFAIGIGSSVDQQELEDIASRSDYVFSVDTFDALITLKTLLAVKACQVEVVPSASAQIESLSGEQGIQGDQAVHDGSNHIHGDQGMNQNQDLWNDYVAPGDELYNKDADSDSEVKTESPMTKGCDGKPAEIVFALDASGSIWNPDFKKQLSFVQDMVSIFQISSEMTRIGVVTFGNHPLKAFHLDKYEGEEDIKDAIAQIHQTRGDTNTAETLHSIRKHFFSPEHVREGVVQVAVIITDGRSMDTEATAHQAQLTRDAGIHLFAIGVGQLIDREELDNIASKPTNQYTFTVNNYDALMRIKKLLAMKTCEVTLPPTTTTTTTPTTTTIPPGCGAHRPADIVFAMPSSANRKQARKVLRMMSDLAAGSKIGDSSIRMGMVPKDCYTVPGFHLKDTVTKEQIISKIDGQYAAATRGTAQIIKYLRENSFKSENGARDGAKRIAVIILDKESSTLDTELQTEDSSVESFKAQMEQGVRMVVVRVGKNADYEKAKAVASDPPDANIFSVDDYGGLAALTDTLSKHFDDICNGVL